MLVGLASLDVGDEVLAAAERAMSLPEYGSRFVTIAEDIQIPFETLETEDIYLFD